MIRRTFPCLIVIACAGIVLTGCTPTFTIEEIKEMRPARPAELDKLNMFAGEWVSTGEATMTGLDEVLKSTGTTESTWGCDGWCLVERSTMNMGELGGMTGLGVWTWDAKAKKYRSSWADDWGTTGRATAKYDDETRTWTMKAKGTGPMGKSVGKGTATFVGDDTVEWTWTEWDSLHLMKVFEGKGTSKRK